MNKCKSCECEVQHKNEAEYDIGFYECEQCGYYGNVNEGESDGNE